MVRRERNRIEKARKKERADLLSVTSVSTTQLLTANNHYNENKFSICNEYLHDFVQVSKRKKGREEKSLR